MSSPSVFYHTLSPPSHPCHPPFPRPSFPVRPHLLSLLSRPPAIFLSLAPRSPSVPIFLSLLSRPLPSSFPSPLVPRPSPSFYPCFSRPCHLPFPRPSFPVRPHLFIPAFPVPAILLSLSTSSLQTNDNLHTDLPPPPD